MIRELWLVEITGVTRLVRIESTALASGGDGVIHRITDEPTLVAKLYHDPEKDPQRLAKLKAMLAAPPELPAMELNDRRYIQIAWPSAWLEEEGRLVGFVMPTVDLSRATLLENLLARRTRAATGLPESYGYRLSAAANLAAVVAELHAQGHHIIDLKPVNLHVYTDVFYLAVLDCDGFSVRGKGEERFPARQFSDGYISPEALQQDLPPQVLGEAQDRFALAVILFQLLNQGLHPFQGVPVDGKPVPESNGERVRQELYAYGYTGHSSMAPSPWSIHTFFDDATRRLFDRAFTRWDDRPSAQEWHRHLLPYTSKGSGKVHACSRNPAHLHFAAGCPWCALERRGQQRGHGQANRSQHASDREQESRPDEIPRGSAVVKTSPKKWLMLGASIIAVLLVLIVWPKAVISELSALLTVAVSLLRVISVILLSPVGLMVTLLVIVFFATGKRDR